MDLETLRQWFTLENVLALIEEYRSFGPLPGILLPLLEAFLPFLPLFLFVMANANAFGLWLGFLYSWIGSVAGALLVFILIRKYGQAKFLRVIKRNEKVQKLMGWVEKHGFGPLFVLLCFPFTPSAVVNIVAGLSRISIAQYMLAIISGKMVMVFTMSFVGHDITSLVTKPIRTAIVAVIIIILWYVGKRIEVKMNMSVEKEPPAKK
ncbi:putative membrane protein YdjX (TVP38/TMEM64 family) [Cytobacillus horneckiae]|uniref:TVP38/TMEM64 family membrane protein n=1 Tax=Cytobacillus horneckiae TaxID=549687 RepID=A0A2N0Z920_9BACI|nr:TVP38/TMEM64 family protein [Cytobacillus horneckiae]MBN6887600.1 TVP38/TMEM64 family protein [Cytobacillus horneckiae]MCM3178659.1 TVP38/TMEM64 family protein [Cytobacillus horneckiae]MEC1157591.1 TVP38/TMEM64 family protein [Cytobacillus horneckiae]MED2939254.1 TVP38/TMEM64 family protein [Cytobacillus horneckiae]PKG26005.1 TVP38/TMEM64 family protein [Cytobacillus horneckiae]